MSMGQTVTAVEFRPFHETIVEDIEKATNEELILLASQIRRTLIPANHDRIAEAWSARRKHMHWVNEDNFLGVLASLLAQKEAAEIKKSAGSGQSQPGIELGELQAAMETFLSLGYNHHLSGNGSMISWHVRLRERLENLHRLLSRALGK